MGARLLRGAPACAMAGALVVALLVGGQAARAEAVWGEVFPMRQPDGTSILVRIWGDEHYTHVESLDGYTLVRDPATRTICYAQLDSQGEALVSTGLPAHATPPAGLQRHLRDSTAVIAARTAASRARLSLQAADGALRGNGVRTTGLFRSICLLVDFPDDPWTIPIADIEAFLNQPGYTGYGNNGSVRDYYLEVSAGQADVTHTVMPFYFRAPQPKSYYTDPGPIFGQRARDLVLMALGALNNSGFDFSTLDADEDGIIDGVSCYYAGQRESAWGEGLWPHSWTVAFTADGVRTVRYQISDLGDGPRLATFCHESGHMLFAWPDLYDYDFESTGVGAFCLMTGQAGYTSAYNPQHPCAYLKDISGWSDTVTLLGGSSNLVAPAGLNVVYKIPHPIRATEYFLLENRQQSGRDVGLPASGLAIWHIDTLGSNDNQQQTPQEHYLVTLVQADGAWDLEHNRNQGDALDLWSAPLYPSFTAVTNPPARWWDGTPGGFGIFGISASAPVMTFSVEFGDDCNSNGIADATEIATGAGTDCNTNGLLDECEAASQDCNSNGVLDACDVDAGTSDDCDANGRPDECQFPQDDCDASGGIDLCEIADGLVTDCDGNLRPDVCDIAGGQTSDCNSNGVPDVCDLVGGASLDCNANSVPDECDLTAGTSADCNANDVPDECDVAGGASTDCDASTIPDECELDLFDCNNNGRHDACDIANAASPDCNANDIPDECDLAAGTSTDCDNDARPDECQLATEDCNANGRVDRCDIAEGSSLDCNHNLRPDECDLSGGFSDDCDASGVPDECELAGRDCNANLVPDVCDLASATSPDCNANATPDECDVASGTSPDCDESGVPDECELAGRDCNENLRPDWCDLAIGSSADCNANALPDECDIASAASMDCDASGVPDECELAGRDCNGNGNLDSCDLASHASADCNKNARPDECDIESGQSLDCNDNLRPDECELGAFDCNANGIPDSCDIATGRSPDCDASGLPDECELAGRDCNANLVPDVCDLDSGASADCNEDDTPDECNIASGASQDCDDDGVPDECVLAQRDCNVNGVIDACDLAAGTSADCNGNVLPDECDLAAGASDCDGSGVPDECELAGRDCNANLVLDSCDLAAGSSFDCNLNARPDECDIAGGTSPDCDANGRPDECELVGRDCNFNNVPDVCDLAAGTSPDCNGNDRPDECDLASGFSDDCDASGVPDECELAGRDCNGNLTLDSCDLAAGVSHDCNLTSIPDECELAGNDCNVNSVPDSCDLAAGTSADCNANLLPDECDLASGFSGDCDASGIPDECELAGRDCDENGMLDSCDLASGAAADCNRNDKPDACDIAAGLADCDSDGVPDVCVLTGQDCNANGILDRCDIAAGARDCDLNEIPDSCEIVGADCDLSGTLDRCELDGRDCNDNAVLDACELATGAAADCNANSLPDVCDIASATSRDDNRNGKPDECEAAPCAVLQPLTLTAPGGVPGDNFGSALALDGRLLIGVWGDSTSGAVAGKAYVYRQTTGDWMVEATLRPPALAPDDNFGRSVALSGNQALIGAQGDDTASAGAGAAYYYWYENGSWVLRNKLIAPDAAMFDEFGSAVAMDGPWAAVGAYADDDRGSASGSVYMLSAGPDGATPHSKLRAADGEPFDYFGHSLALASTTLLVGADGDDDRAPDAGAAYIFTFVGNAWVQGAKLRASDGGAADYFGIASALDGGVAVIGAPGDDDLGTDAGAAYVFRFNGSQWVEERKLLAPDGRGTDRFGTSVAVRGDWILVGAVGQDALANNAGAAYLYRFDGGSWTFVGRYPAGTALANQQYGHAVAIDDDNAAVGSLHYTGPGKVALIQGLNGDCNANGKLDLCDISQALSTDCNGDDQPDECQSFGFGDANGDGLSNTADLAGLIACLAGPAAAPGGVASCATPCSAMFDHDGDADVDLRDFAAWQRAWGP